MLEDVDGEPLGRLPPGRHGLSREDVAASQRTRLLRAVCEAVGTKGYASTTIADVHALADVSKKTFYVHFRDQEDCFLTAYDASVDLILEQMTVAYRAASGDWRQRYRASVDAFCAILSARPVRTRALLLEVLAAGPKVLARRRRVMQRFESNLRQIHTRARTRDSGIPNVPDELFAIAVGGIDELVRDLILKDRLQKLPSLAPVISLNFEWLLGKGLDRQPDEEHNHVNS